MPKVVGVILTIALILAVIVAGVFYFQLENTKKQLEAARAELSSQNTNDKVLEFGQLFVNKILKAEGPISFEERLFIETAVRDLKDEDISRDWAVFLASKNEVEAQNAVKNLLGTLFDKVERN